MRPTRRLLAALAVTLLAGCPAEPTFPPLYPLTGTVRDDDGPMKGGGVIFLREAGDPTGLLVNATVGPDGRLTGNSSYTSARGAVVRDGVPAGRFKAVYHPPSDGSRSGLERPVAGVFEFQAGPNEIALVLTGPAPAGSGQPRDDANPPGTLGETPNTAR